MTDHVIWLAAAVLLASAYLATLKLALLKPSRLAIRQELETRGKRGGAEWLMPRFDAAVFATSFFRTVTRLGFFMLVLAEVVELGTDTPLTWTHLLISGAIAVPALWIFTTVLASAVARYSAAGIISTGLPLIRGMVWLSYPLVKPVSVIDEVVRRLSGTTINEQEEREAELLRSIEETQREGGLDEEAASMMENVVELKDTDVAEIMTPRTDIEGIGITNDLEVIKSFLRKVGHSRVPVYRENLDHVVGILYVKDLVPYLGRHANDFKLEPILRQPIIVPETKPVRELLGDFQKSKVHMAIVIDEYGGTEGLVTIEDVLEEIVGEIRDEHDPAGDQEPTLVTIDDTRAEVDGRFHIDDLNECLGLELPEDDDFDTIGGFVLATLGHVPDVGETFEAHDARFTALATALTHVRRVRIELLGGQKPNGRRNGNGP